MPGFDVVVGRYTLVPNPFWGGVLFPRARLRASSSSGRRSSGVSPDDRRFHNLLDRPRDNPWRTAIGAAMVSLVLIVFLAGSADRVDVLFGVSYSAQIWVYRVLVLVGPPLVFLVTWRLCRELVAGEHVRRERQAAEAEARAGVTPTPPG